VRIAARTIYRGGARLDCRFLAAEGLGLVVIGLGLDAVADERRIVWVLIKSYVLHQARNYLIDVADQLVEPCLMPREHFNFTEELLKLCVGKRLEF